MPGVAVVYFHNRWTAGWPVLITVMGWLSLVIGAVRILFPMWLTGIVTKDSPTRLAIMPGVAAVFLIVGGVLSFKAYAPSAAVM